MGTNQKNRKRTIQDVISVRTEKMKIAGQTAHALESPGFYAQNTH